MGTPANSECSTLEPTIRALRQLSPPSQEAVAALVRQMAEREGVSVALSASPGLQAPIEGGPDSDGDRHVLVLDRDNCILYETFDAWPQPDGSWYAGSGAIIIRGSVSPAQ